MKSLSQRLKLNVFGLQYVRMCVCVLPVSVLMICYFQLFDSDLDGFWLTPTLDWTSKWAKHRKFIKQLYDQSGLLHVYHLSQTQRRYLLRMSSLTSSGQNTHKSAQVSNLLPTVVSLSSLNQTWGAKRGSFFFQLKWDTLDDGSSSTNWRSISRSGLDKGSLTSTRNLTLSLTQPGYYGQLLILPFLLVTSSSCMCSYWTQILSFWKSLFSTW